MKLVIELVPSTVWYNSIYRFLRDANRASEWKKIKDRIFLKEGRSCWICGNRDRSLQAHEFWEYDDEKNIQKLAAIHHLCDLCHKIKHIGFWCHTSDGEEKLRRERLRRADIINHFCKVNSRSIEEFRKHEEEAFKRFEDRSKHEWKQDFGEYETVL